MHWSTNCSSLAHIPSWLLVFFQRYTNYYAKSTETQVVMRYHPMQLYNSGFKSDCSTSVDSTTHLSRFLHVLFIFCDVATFLAIQDLLFLHLQMMPI
ncbi:hypothetical protein PVAP13_4NG159300 [Panicum virgatum]|uniref:Uncharacterized protein n=1 Tax=Panicum virgatum TaxID=38727 RepID=A0A8T0T8L1_PANVG|nr:hypothetical protein PVAP13_4NG159300 [Panicum virgatum]